MDSFELNKILGAILGTLLFVMGLGFLAEAIYQPRESGPGYDLPAPADDTTTTNTPLPAAVDIGTLLAKADAKAGESAAKKCGACHDFTEGGPNKIGPNLYDVVERQIASHPGFSYSADLSSHSSETWTYDKLNTWLTAPKSFAPGTKMTYSGDKDDTDRANIIAFLASLSHSPKPFPPAAPATGGEAPASSQLTEGTSSVAAPASQPAADTVSTAPAAPDASSAAPASSAASSAQ